MKMRDIGLMRASITLWSLVVAVLSLLVSRTAVADDWNFVIAPYLLVPTITGDASLGRVDNAEVDLSGADIFKSLQLGAMLQGEARHASGYGVLLNYAFMDLGNDFSGPRGYTNVDTDVFQGILEGFATRRFEYSGGVVDGYGGVRWWDIGIDVDASTPLGDVSYSRDVDWVDPVIGARWMPRLSDAFRLLLQGDVGGVGAASKFTWCAQGGVIWDASGTTSITLLYKALGVDYESGTRGTSSYFEYNTITQGPLLGLVFRL